MNSITLKITTAHYSFEMIVTKYISIIDVYTLKVINNDNPCLEVNIISHNTSGIPRFDPFSNTANLININAIQESSLDDILDEYMVTHSFGTELVEAVTFFINSQFPNTTTVRLYDTSYIPCIRESIDTLDLLIYSVALYKKTWYEHKLNAYIKPREKYDKYRRQVEEYGSKEKKSSIDFFDIYILVLQSSMFSQEIFNEKYAEFEEIFKNSETLPDFFKSISKKVDRNKRSRFFKGWLEEFISSQINIEREWHYDLFPKIEENQMGLKVRESSKT